MAPQERLYRMAVERAERAWSVPGLRKLGHTLEKAVILSEIVYMMAAQDNVEDGFWTALAAHAVSRAADREG